MMGHFSSGLSFAYETIHRWPEAQKFPQPNQDNLVYQNSLTVFNLYPPGSTVPFSTQTIHTLYHHYKRLSEFAGNIDFNVDYIPYKHFNKDDSGNPDHIESYYLVNPDGSTAYGWVRNLNHIWFNEYYYKPAYYAHLDCQNSSSPSTSFYVQGLIPNASYDVSFYPTVMGTQPLPTWYSTTANNQGKVLIDMSTMPLGCDSINSDYAYAVIAPPQLRLTNPNLSNPVPKFNNNKQRLIDQRLFEFTILPNPNAGVFRVTIPLENNETATINLFNVTGRIVYEAINISYPVLNLDLKNYGKGVYYLQLLKSKEILTKKIIIQ